MHTSEWHTRGRAKALVCGLAVLVGSACTQNNIVPEPQTCEVPDAGSTPTPDAGTPAVDTDVVLARFNADGSLDTTFGTEGVARIDLGKGQGTVRDSLWSVARDDQNRLVLFGTRRGDGLRDDSDRVVVRLTAEGALDTTFATNGVHTLNIANLNDNARHGFIQADGKIVTSGYTAQPTGVGTLSENRIVLLRLNSDGKPDTTFGYEGIVNSNPFSQTDPLKPWGMAEAYVVRAQSNGYVTTGYGRAGGAANKVDMVSFRYTLAGAFDMTWGNNGVATLDVVGDNDRGRNLIVLPDDRVLMVGSGTPAAGNVDAMVALYTANGQLDTSFSEDGYQLYDFGRPDEAFFGAAVSPAGDWIAAVGYRTGGTGADDALLFLMPLGGTGTGYVNAVNLSESGNDRLWNVTFDATGKLYATGYIEEGGDSQVVVSRFNMDGSLDSAFGTGGVVRLNAVSAGKEEMARGIAVLSDGKVVVAGVAERL